ETWAFAALGLLELSEGAHERAVEYLRPVWDAFSRAEARDPGGLWWQGDLLEALVATGARADAERLVRELDDQVQATGRVWGEAIAARGRGLLALAPARRDEELTHSAALLDDIGAPFERARSLLLLGEGRVQRGDEREATAQLEDALDSFQRLGAAPWVARAEAALGAERDAPVASVALLLTSAELRVAMAVAKGCTNREAGEELFLSTRTVDAHLRAIYRKLDIRTRTELALMLASMEPPESTATSAG